MEQRIITAKDNYIELDQWLRENGCKRLLMVCDGSIFYMDAFNKHLGVVCRSLALNPRSMHKIRKTYGTTLIDSDVDERFVMEQMGHSDISTTKKYYYFSNKSTENKVKQINSAISF